MLLAIDVGNSHTVFGLFDGATLLHHWRVRTTRQATADELAASFHNLFALRGIQLNQITSMVIGSVVPALLSPLLEVGRLYCHTTPLVVSAATCPDIEILIDFPSEVGADRIINAVAARRKYGTPVVIVDFGTAITFDCVNPDGNYMGGAIFAGLGIAMDALGSRTAKLPRVDISIAPGSPIGTNTESAIRAGFLYGYGGMVEGVVGRIRQQMHPNRPKIIATGGMAHLIAPFAPSIETVDPLLTLEGLQIIHATAHSAPR